MKRSVAMLLIICFFLLPFTVAADENEPPINPFLADSPWAMSHRNPYCQASSPYPGPDAPVNIFNSDSDYLLGQPGMITIAISAPYPDGNRALWTSAPTKVVKIDPNGNNWEYVDKFDKSTITLDSLGTLSTEDGLTGAYTLLDRDNIFYVPEYSKITAYGDAVDGDVYSSIELKREYEIPDEYLRDPSEKIVGLTMTYDGFIVFVTDRGLLCAISRDFEDAHYFSFEEGEEISNSIACDEDGGIYVVTSKKIYRVQWSGSSLSTDEADGGWSADYETGEAGTGLRLGDGSGSTPTLMGTGSQDKFVVVTDGLDLMNIVLLWRDQIPSDWEQIYGTKDRRIAAQVPVTFGDPDAVDSLSEQSVCVRGYGAFVVNNQLKTSLSNGFMDLFASGISLNAPYGAEKFEWDPVSRTLNTVWVNTCVSWPNGIPAMSAETNLVYDVGQKLFGGWAFEALDWDTGEMVFSFRYGTGILFNSAYSGVVIDMDSSLYIGGFGGPSRMYKR